MLKIIHFLFRLWTSRGEEQEGFGAEVGPPFEPGDRFQVGRVLPTRNELHFDSKERGKTKRENKI